MKRQRWEEAMFSAKSESERRRLKLSEPPPLDMFLESGSSGEKRVYVGGFNTLEECEEAAESMKRIGRWKEGEVIIVESADGMFRYNDVVNELNPKWEKL